MNVRAAGTIAGTQLRTLDNKLDKIRQLLNAGLLPSDDTARGFISVGWGRTCDVCETLIPPDQRAQDLEFWNTILVRLHAECAELYEIEVRRRKAVHVIEANSR